MQERLIYPKGEIFYFILFYFFVQSLIKQLTSTMNNLYSTCFIYVLALHSGKDIVPVNSSNGT